jgi:hypothetical protein
MLYIILRGCWCYIIALNVHAPTEDEINYVMDSFYEELECVFYKFPQYNMKILLGDLNVEVGRESIFTPTIGIKSLNEISNDYRVRLVNTMFPGRKIHVYMDVSCVCVCWRRVITLFVRHYINSVADK